MERGLDRFFKICKDLFESPEKTSVEKLAGYVTQELSAGHIAHLTDCFQTVTDEIGDLSETDFATLDKLFELGFHLMIPFIPNVLEAVLHDDVVCTPDAMDMLLSLFRLLNASCEKSTRGKTNLAPLVPALIRDFLLNEERGTPLRVEAVKLTNMIFEETVYDERNGLDTISLALKDLEENIEHQLASAGDFELQAGLVELIFHLIPEMVRQDKAHVYFSNSSVAQAFIDIKSSEFEAGCRYFLNTLNQNLKENQSVASFPCYSATFGTAEVHPPIDPKISDFWVDFNLKSRSISLYVEERDNEGNSKDENSLWELLLIKAEIVQDYRLTGTGKNDIVLLLKLRVSASDVVTFLHNNCSHPGLSAVLPKILGNPKCQNSGGESDVNSTPSKASVAINPVHIRSRNREMSSYVMPTASLMLQLSDGTTDQEEEARQEQEKAGQTTGKVLMPNKNSSKNNHGKDISRGKDQSEHADKNRGNNLYGVKEKKSKRISDEPVSGEDDVHKDSNKVENEGKPGKRTSTRITSKSNLEQSKETDISEGDENARSDSSGKSYPAVFNVSERVAASKRKSVPTMSLSDTSKRRKAIEKRVFSKPVCSPPVSEDVEVSELHMVAPPRRRKPRSGKRRRGKCKPIPVKGNKERKAEKLKTPFSSSSSSVFSVTSDISCYDQGLVSRNRLKDLVALDNEDHTDIIQDSMPLADSLEDEDQSVNGKEKRAGKRATIPVTSPTKERTKKRGTVLSSPATVRKTKRLNTLDDKSLERSRKEIKKSTTQKGTLQSLKTKYQEYEDTYNLNEPEVINELDDVHEIANEQVTGDDDLIDDELTDCYVEEAFPTITSPPVALTSQSRTRRRSPVRKVRQTRQSRLDVPSWKEVSAEDSPVRKQKDNVNNGRGYRKRKAQNEVHLNIATTPDDINHSDESDGNYDEEDVDKEPVGHEKTIVVSRTRRSEREDTGITTDHGDEGIDSEEEEFDFKSTDLDYDFNVSITPRLIRPQSRQSKPLAPDSRQSGSLKRSLVLSDSGIGETPFRRKKQDKMNIPRRRSWQPLTPVTPRLEQVPDDEENSGDAESDEASVRSNGTPGQETLDIKHRKKKFVDWSTSGPSTLYDLSTSGVTPSRMEGNFKNPMHVSERAHMLSYRSQQFGKPRKLFYDEEPFNIQEGEDLINDTSEEEIRNEVQGLIKIAGGEVFKSVRRKRQMIKSFLVRTTEMVLSSNDTRRNEQLEASYSAVKSNRSQLTEQIHSLERDFGKTASTIKEMENTINTFQNTVGKQFKILKGQRQIEEKRFKGVHHLHKSIEAELTKLERNRSEQEATFRAELEKETLRFKKKFLQDTRKQKEDQLKMMLNILQIP